MPPLSIAIDYRPALLGRSGIPRAARELARALAEREDVDVRLFGHSFSRARVPVRVPRGARLARLPIPGRALEALARLGLDGATLAGGGDVFHWTDYVHPPVGARTPVVATVHDCAFAVDPSFHGSDAAVLAERTRAAVDRARLVVCPTRATANDVEERLGVAPEKVRVVAFGADHVVATPPVERDGPIVMLGTIEPRKNHLRALAAWRALGAQRPELVVVGAEGWCCDETVAALRRAERDGVRWLRGASDAELDVLTARAVAMLYPSLYEGFGFPALEALARGIPVVAGDTPALREVLADHAEWCDARDVDSIRAALERALAGDGPSAARVAHAARFRWAECAARHVDVYREAVT